MKRVFPILICMAAIILAASCSTTRVLQDGEYRLAKNKVNITNDPKFNPSTLDPYLKQRPNQYFILG